MADPKEYKDIHKRSSRLPAASDRSIALGFMQLLSVVVALAVATPGVAIIIWIIDTGRSTEPALAALVLFLFGVSALIAAPTGLYRNGWIQGVALTCAGLLGCATPIAIFMALVLKSMEDVGPNPFPLQVVTPAAVTALSAAAILVHKVRSGHKLSQSRRSTGGTR
jgi:hypothetical protein